jgi:hypothetical protein
MSEESDAIRVLVDVLDDPITSALYAISHGLKTTEPREGQTRTAADGLCTLAEGAHRIAAALERIADAMEDGES